MTTMTFGPDIRQDVEANQQRIDEAAKRQDRREQYITEAEKMYRSPDEFYEVLSWHQDYPSTNADSLVKEIALALSCGDYEDAGKALAKLADELVPVMAEEYADRKIENEEEV